MFQLRSATKTSVRSAATAFSVRDLRGRHLIDHVNRDVIVVEKDLREREEDDTDQQQLDGFKGAEHWPVEGGS